MGVLSSSGGPLGRPLRRAFHVREVFANLKLAEASYRQRASFLKGDLAQRFRAPAVDEARRGLVARRERR